MKKEGERIILKGVPASPGIEEGKASIILYYYKSKGAG